MEKDDFALESNLRSLFTGRGGDPELHRVFWMESQWERPERPTVHGTGLVGGPPPHRDAPWPAASQGRSKHQAPSRHGVGRGQWPRPLKFSVAPCHPQGQLSFLNLPAGPIFTSLRFTYGSECVGVCAGYTPGAFSTEGGGQARKHTNHTSHLVPSQTDLTS